MSGIHPTAVIEPGARLGERVTVGPFAVVGGGVEIGDDARIGPHAVLEGRVVLGARSQVFSGAVLGGAPQDLKFRADTPSGVRVGADTVIREHVTIHRASVEEGWTTVGDGCFLMGSSHVAHDCQVGSHVILTSYTAITGWVEVGDRAVLSGLVGIHQFVRIGTLAMVSGCSRVGQDVPPYFIVEGNPVTARGVNIVGLRRAGVPAEVRLELQRAYKLLYRAGHATHRALELIRSELHPHAEVKHLADFIASSKRGIC